MPQLTIKTEYVQKLKELGVYDQWLGNIKTQWVDSECALNPTSKYHSKYINKCVDNISFNEFVNFSFGWTASIEGFDFWNDIYESESLK